MWCVTKQIVILFCLIKSCKYKDSIFFLLLPAADKRCISTLYVIGFTSGIPAAGSDNSPFVEIRLFNGLTKSRRFPDNPGNDMFPNKGDLWVIPIARFGFLRSCITRGMVQSVTVKPGGNDGWNIKSIVTLVGSGNGEHVLTEDLNANRWIDGNGPASQKAFPLTIYDC